MTSQLLLLSLLFLALTPGLESCGKKKDKDEGQSGDGLALTGPAAFVGDWNGIYSPLNGDGKPDGDSRVANATFYEDGKFKIALADDTSAIAEGTWSEFGGKSLFLTVKKSTISRISTAKAVLDMSYDLTGSSVDIHNNDFKLKISRLKESSPSGSETAKNGPAGQWNCSGSGKDTVLNISGSDDGFKWRGTIAQEGHSLLVMSGSGHPAPASNYTLVIESSQPETIKGSTLSFTLQGTGATLSALAPSGKRDSLGDCHRD